MCRKALSRRNPRLSKIYNCRKALGQMVFDTDSSLVKQIAWAWLGGRVAAAGVVPRGRRRKFAGGEHGADLVEGPPALEQRQHPARLLGGVEWPARLAPSATHEDHLLGGQDTQPPPAAHGGGRDPGGLRDLLGRDPRVRFRALRHGPKIAGGADKPRKNRILQIICLFKI